MRAWQHPTRLNSRVALHASQIVIQCLTLATTGSELFEYGKPLSEIALGNSPTVLAAQVCSIPCRRRRRRRPAAAAFNPSLRFCSEGSAAPLSTLVRRMTIKLKHWTKN